MDKKYHNFEMDAPMLLKLWKWLVDAYNNIYKWHKKQWKTTGIAPFTPPPPPPPPPFNACTCYLSLLPYVHMIFVWKCEDAQYCTTKNTNKLKKHWILLRWHSWMDFFAVWCALPQWHPFYYWTEAKWLISIVEQILEGKVAAWFLFHSFYTIQISLPFV